MKIWYGYGSEHSANLVIIGKFEDAGKAGEAKQLLDRLVEVSLADAEEGWLDVNKGDKRKFSDRLMTVLTEENFHDFNYGDPEQLLYDFKAQVDGDKLVITTDETTINAFLKVMIAKSAKVEIYSAHDHGGPYGRWTRG